ncbi:hypothetical protein [Roseomonas sp. HF4]|uniref:cell division protein FtsL n=1 Tax=Roseomonas sp. HF4 TaxID=2562313 RepID=UPI0010C0C508|nr:hypothetical protein [Roseomonas sp. HF4]
MIRPLTLLSLAAAAGAGLYLYQVKHAVSQLDRELREIHRHTEQARERTQVLTAEWALLNEPERLRQVAQRHLSLEPMAPAQFARMAEMRQRLPAARDFAGPPSFLPPAASAATALAAATPRAPVAPAPAAPAALAVVQPAPPAAEDPTRTAEAPARAAEPALRHAERPAEGVAEPAVPPRRLAAAAPPRPARAPEAPVRRAVHVQPAEPPPAARRVVAAAPPSASIFGGGLGLAPPVPVARAATLPAGSGR